MKRALFIVDDKPEAGRGHVVRSGALAAELQARGWETHVNEPERIYDADVTVWDVKDREGDFWGNRVVVIDDHKPQRCGAAGIIVNGGAGAREEMYRECGADLVLAGPKYALLREPFRYFRWGSVAYQYDLKDVRGLDGGWTTEGVADFMASARLVITAGGMRSMEAACVGAPMILFIESEDQEMNAQALQRKCAGVIARDEEYAQRLAKELLKDTDWLARMSAAGRRLVDGLGCKRVADAIEALV